jgi:hypothetical protein
MRATHLIDFSTGLCLRPGAGVVAIEGSVTVDLNEGDMDTLNVLADTSQTSQLATEYASYAAQGGADQVVTLVTAGGIQGLGTNFTLRCVEDL